MTKRSRAAAEAGFAADQRQRQSGWDLLKPSVQARLEAVAVLADCQICVKETVFTGLHRLKLAEASGVLRGLFNDVDDSNSITLHGDTPQQVALMLSLMYLPTSESLTQDNAYAALAICAKYDLADLQAATEQFILNIPLTTVNLPIWLQRAAEADFEPGINSCLHFAYDGDNLNRIMLLQSDAWMHALPAGVLTRLLAPKLRVTEMARRAMAETLDWCMQSATEPEADIYWPPDTGAFRHYKGSQDGRPMDRDTIRVVLESVRQQGEHEASAGLGGGRTMRAALLQPLLPAACDVMDDIIPYIADTDSDDDE